jgi:hypothetical protein
MPAAFSAESRQRARQLPGLDQAVGLETLISGNDDDAASLAFEQCIARLEDVVEQETAALRSRASTDLRDFTNRKSQGLLELSRSMRLFQVARPSNAVLARLAGLREKLDTNSTVLKRHLEAVREVSTIMADAIRDAESDGTYQPSARAAANRYD